MDDNQKAFIDLSPDEQLKHRHQPEWHASYKDQAAFAEAKLLQFRLGQAVNVIRGKSTTEDLAPFTGLGAALLTPPPGTGDLSHGDSLAIASQGIGTQRMGTLSRQLNRGVDGNDQVLKDWHRSRSTLFQRPAPWTVITTPQIKLLSQYSHPLSPIASQEKLLPHATSWSQTLYLALRHRINGINRWVAKNHPEWAGPNGEIQPFSMVAEDAELSPEEMIEREQRLLELSFLRDLRDMGVLYLSHWETGRPFYHLSGVSAPVQAVPSSAEDWQKATVEQGYRWQRIQGRSGTLTDLDGEYDALNATSKGQCLCLMAAYACLPMEEALYDDRSNGYNEARQALFFNTRWITPERLILLERMVSLYQASGLNQDLDDYQELLEKNGVAPAVAADRAQMEFEIPVLSAIEQTLGVIESLSYHHLRQVSVDIGEAYISILDTARQDPRTPARNSMGFQRFGLSVDPSKVDERVLTEIGATISLNRPWVMRRGFQPRIFEVMNQSIKDRGFLGIKMDGDYPFAEGADLQSKALDTEFAIRSLTAQLRKATAMNDASESESDRLVEEANRLIKQAWTEHQKLGRQSQNIVHKNHRLEHALATSEDLFLATNIATIEMLCEADGVDLPPIREPSRAAGWLHSHGYKVRPNHEFLHGKPRDHGPYRNAQPVTLDEAYVIADRYKVAVTHAKIPDLSRAIDDDDEAQGPTQGPRII